MAQAFVMVAIYDAKVEAFSRPQFVRSRGEALRSFTDEVNRVAADNPLNAHPEDFALYYLGLYADEAGGFEIPDKPVKLQDAVTVRV